MVPESTEGNAMSGSERMRQKGDGKSFKKCNVQRKYKWITKKVLQ